MDENDVLQEEIISEVDSKNFGNVLANERLDSKEEGQFLSTNKKKLQDINAVIYTPDKDPLFFVYLNRLAKAKEFAETDRVDGRDALDKFIFKESSLIAAQGRAKYDTSAEKLKQKFIDEFGEDPPQSADGESAIDLLAQGIKLLLMEKQTLKDVKTKELSMDIINNFLQQSYIGADGKKITTPTPDMIMKATGMSMPVLREKNLIQKRMANNRSPDKMGTTLGD